MEGILLVEPDNNRRGTIFTQRMADVLHALGWEDFRFDVARTGREIDVAARHRAEPKSLRAECKAEKTAIGGATINKFAGAVQVERAGAPGDVVAYFISLNGFKASALEQEQEAGHRMTLLGPDDIVRELVAASVLVDPQAAMQVVRSSGSLPKGATVEDARLIAHRIGWIWAVFAHVGHERRYVSFVHASGDGLSDSLSQEILASDAEHANVFESLTPVSVAVAPLGTSEEAVEQYRAFLQKEFGHITLEGMPADERVGSRAIPLSDLYIPMSIHRETVATSDTMATESLFNYAPTSLHHFLSTHRHAAIVGPPGSGKSTIVKHLATADNARPFFDSATSGPGPEPLPLVIRCRTLDSLSRAPLSEVIDNIIERAELGIFAEGFTQAVQAHLREGTVLLLIDGLDEIAHTGDRAAFASQLRTFLATYPSIRLVVTSRASAFRTVASALRPICELGRVADLSPDDIRALCRKWQAQVAGIDDETDSLATEVLANRRVRSLAVNPLLLTTMLLVKRWVGELPRKRTVLYDKAIEVLASTWNVEAHEPLDLDEVMPQLGYVAFQMLSTGKQQVGVQDLRRLLEEARRDLPEILGFARLSPSQLVDAVEHRSSLLSLTAHAEIDGKLQPVYEFKHLAFQEYLTARAVVEGWHPASAQRGRFIEVLAPHIGEESWDEVIPLVGLLAGRDASLLVQELISKIWSSENREAHFAQRALERCLEDEVQITPAVAREACIAYVRSDLSGYDDAVFSILHGKFADVYKEVAWTEATNLAERPASGCSALVRIAMVGEDREANSWMVEREGGLAYARSRLASEELKDRVTALAIAMEAGYFASGVAPAFLLSDAAEREPEIDEDAVHELGAKVRARLIAGELEHDAERFAAFWALAWMNETMPYQDGHVLPVVNALVSAWQSAHHPEVARMASWALGSLPIRKHLLGSLPPTSSVTEFLIDVIAHARTHFELRGAVTALLYGGIDPGSLPFDREAVTREFSGMFSERWLERLIDVLSDTPLKKALQESLEIMKEEVISQDLQMESPT